MALTRSQQMARIKGRDTKPEKRLRAHLWARGLRYRLRANVPIGRPDLAFPGARVAVFVDGCFWHGCPVHYVRPRSRRQFWADKLTANLLRDRRHTATLEAAGWTVVRLWEHEVSDALETAGDAVAQAVRKGQIPAGPNWRVARVDPIEDTPASGESDWERRYLVDLRDPSLTRVEEGPRTTRSGRPRRPRRQS